MISSEAVGCNAGGGEAYYGDAHNEADGDQQSPSQDQRDVAAVVCNVPAMPSAAATATTIRAGSGSSDAMADWLLLRPRA